MAKSEGEEATRQLYEQLVAYVEQLEKYLEKPSEASDGASLSEPSEQTLERVQSLLEQVNLLRANDRKIRKSMGIDEGSFLAQIEEAKRKGSGLEGKLNEKIERLKGKMRDMEDRVKRELRAQEGQPVVKTPEKKSEDKKKKQGQKGSFRRSMGDDQWKKL
jgi:hypothetical protein